jgi:hypothetical protein
MPTPYSRLTTAQLTALLTAQLGTLQPYQIRQVFEFLSRVHWGSANSASGEGSDSNVANQPTISQIVTLLGTNNP